MAYIVSSPGSCGEFIQGYMDGISFMVTCPINRYSYAMSQFDGPGDRLPKKAALAVKKTLNYLGEEDRDIPIRLKSNILPGKGMASSTADISAVAQAVALSCGKRLTAHEIADIALSIEPSDATFFNGIVRFDHRGGTLIQQIGDCPPLKILIYDCGGEIDTVDFNTRADLVDLQKENEKYITIALNLFRKGIQNGSIDEIGRASSISAFANQKILYKKQLNRFYKVGMQVGGKGIICAHSGTVLGLIVSADGDIENMKQSINEYMGKDFSYLDSVEIINQGIIDRKCDANEFDKE